jgi:DNA polymerase V
MADLLALDLVDKHLVTDQMVLTVGYDIQNLKEPGRRGYHGEITTDRYGRRIPKHGHGTANLDEPTSSTRQITDAVMELYDRIVNPSLLVRRLNLVANHIVPEDSVVKQETYEQMDLFTDYEALQREREQKEAELQKERKLQQAMLDIKKKYGKNAILKGMNLEEGATARKRNQQIGGHKA